MALWRSEEPLSFDTWRRAPPLLLLTGVMVGGLAFLNTWDLLTFGLKPFWAFTLGVIVNVPLGYFLSTVAFSKYWSKISEMM